MKNCSSKCFSKNLFIIPAFALFMAVGYLLFGHHDTKSQVTLNDKQTPSYLFVQTAKNGTIKAEDPAKKSYKLTINQVSPTLSYFTDQPLRETGTIPVTEFVKLWKDEPNVVVHAVDENTNKTINRIFALSKPSYDAKTRSMSYQAQLLGDQTLDSNDLKMDHTTIFIDDLRWHGNRFDPPGTNGN